MRATSWSYCCGAACGAAGALQKGITPPWCIEGMPASMNQRRRMLNLAGGKVVSDDDELADEGR